MTPERWRQIDDLFDAALRLNPAEREAWLRGAWSGAITSNVCWLAVWAECGHGTERRFGFC